MKKCIHFLIVAIAGFFWACHPEPDSKQLIDQLVVSTNYDPAINFSGYTTYSIPTDTIGFSSNTSNDTIITSNNSTYPAPVLKAVRTNLNMRGYVEVPRNQKPDLAVNVIVVNDYNVFQQVVYPSYGGYGYPGGYYSGYYGYSSYYSYPYVNTYAYNTGVLIVEMVDLKNKTPDNKVKVIWDAYMGDVYSTLNRIQESVDAIDQSFTQSPYIGK